MRVINKYKKSRGFTPHLSRGKSKSVRIYEEKGAGFTLIELLVVIAIIGLLATLAVISLNNARAKSRDAKRVSDIRQVQTALELYFSDNDLYPPGAGGVLGGTSGSFQVLCDSAAGWQANTTGCGAVYMPDVPENPTPNGADYIYTQVGGGDDYTVTFTLESGTGSLSSGGHTASSSGIN